MDKMDKSSETHMLNAFEKFMRMTISNKATDLDRSKKSLIKPLPFSAIWDDVIEAKLQISDEHIGETSHIFSVRGFSIYIDNGNLATALMRLPQNQRETLLMYYCLKMNDDQIGQVFDCSRRVANTLRHKSLDKLKEYMMESEHE